MSHALTIALLLGCLIFVSVVVGCEMFLEEPQAPPRGRPSGGRDPKELYIPPVRTIAPITHDAYGIPEHEFSEGQILSNTDDQEGQSNTVSQDEDTLVEPFEEDKLAAESAPIRTGNVTMDALLTYIPDPPELSTKGTGKLPISPPRT